MEEGGLAAGNNMDDKVHLANAEVKVSPSGTSSLPWLGRETYSGC